MGLRTTGTGIRVGNRGSVIYLGSNHSPGNGLHQPTFLAEFAVNPSHAILIKAAIDEEFFWGKRCEGFDFDNPNGCPKFLFYTSPDGPLRNEDGFIASIVRRLSKAVEKTYG